MPTPKKELKPVEKVKVSKEQIRKNVSKAINRKVQ